MIRFLFCTIIICRSFFFPISLLCDASLARNVLLIRATIVLKISCSPKIRTVSSSLTLHSAALGNGSVNLGKKREKLDFKELKKKCHWLDLAPGPDTGCESHVCALGFNTAQSRHDHRVTADQTVPPPPLHPNKYSITSNCDEEACRV